MKFLLNILAILTILTVAFPQEAAASCCSKEKTTCHEDPSQEEENGPCDSDCGCECCGSISVVSLFLKSAKSETEKPLSNLAFFYESFSDSFFKSSIWQPPRLRS